MVFFIPDNIKAIIRIFFFFNQISSFNRTLHDTQFGLSFLIKELNHNIYNCITFKE